MRYFMLLMVIALFAGVALAVGPSSVPEPLSNPGSRIGHALAYNEGRGRTVLFGGIGPDGVPKGDTWEWDGEVWHALSADGPSPRKWPAAAYDAVRGRVVLFGGREGVGRAGSSRGDTWEWDGKAWRRLSSDGPSGRDHHGMVYDRAREAMVLFGGWDGQSVVGDTWEWNGTWTKVAEGAPPARAAHAMAYDRQRQTTVLFGGRALEKFYDDTWLWNGKVWTQSEALGPSERAFHGMVYDAARRHTLLFGGRLDSELYGDTWSWDGREWTELRVVGPSKRYVYSMAYDGNHNQVLFFGGGHRGTDTWVLFGETWLWNGTKWHRADGSTDGW
jgi:hypothetical protein